MVRHTAAFVCTAFLLDLESTSARWLIIVAVASLAVVFLITLGIFLGPAHAWLLARFKRLALRGPGDGVDMQGHIVAGGRPLSALSAVRSAAGAMAGAGAARSRELVDYCIAQAWNLGASDLHFTPTPEGMTVQVRVDGQLYDITSAPPEVHSGTIIRLKVLSRVNVYKKDIPQDGRILVDLDPPIHIRMSTLPTIHGEKAVLRFRSRAGRLHRLEDLGFDPLTLQIFRDVLARPQGLVLVTGPTGSGKTTTLYASMEEIRARRGSHLNIVTIEDPVEFEMPFLSQTQVSDEAGLTFARGLRSLLRQDPNIIMVGEIRDQETADIAMHAGLTGHLILSTVHADSSPGVFARLLNMNIEPYVLASATSAVLGQRLLRKLCPHCREQAFPTAHEIEQLHRLGVTLTGDDGPFYKSRGCQKCFDIGVHGRTGIFELLVVDEVLQQELVKQVRTHELHSLALERGMKPLIFQGMAKVGTGEVSIEEVLAVVSGT